MSTNVIKQTIVGSTSTQTIKQIVRSNERGPIGPQGETGPDGYSPQVSLVQNTSTTATLSITSKNNQGQTVTQSVTFGGTWRDADEERF